MTVFSLISFQDPPPILPPHPTPEESGKLGIERMVKAVVSNSLLFFFFFFKGRKFPLWIYLEQKWYLGFGLAPTFIHVGTFYLVLIVDRFPLPKNPKEKNPIL